MIWPFVKNKVGRASKVNITAPTPNPDRHGLAIVAILRNEADYLHDWLTFHTLAGAREIILYDNGSTDNTLKIARNFTGLKVTILPWILSAISHKPAVVLPQQIMAYCHAVCTFGANFRWLAFIDIDEFIVPRNKMTILDVLENLEDHSNISLPWIMFGHNKHKAQPDMPVPFAYTQRSPDLSGALLNFKCIVDPCDVTQVSTHKFRTKTMGRNTTNSLGKVKSVKARGNTSFLTEEHLCLNHYYLKSQDETEAKISGGAVSGVSKTQRETAIRLKARLIEANTVSDTSAIDFLMQHNIASGQDLVNYDFCQTSQAENSNTTRGAK